MVAEGPIPPVQEQKIRHRVVGHEQVGPAVTIAVLDRHTKNLALELIQARPARHLAEAAASISPEQLRRARLEHRHRTVFLGRRPEIALEADLVSGLPVDVVSDEEIQLSITVVVEEGRGADPATQAGETAR